MQNNVVEDILSVFSKNLKYLIEFINLNRTSDPLVNQDFNKQLKSLYKILIKKSMNDINISN